MGKARDLANVGSVASSGLQFRNKIINGAMTVDQRNNGASVSYPVGAPGNNSHALDRWNIFKQSGSGAYSIQRSSVAPAGFINSLAVTVTSAFASTESTSAVNAIQQTIEGLNVSDLGWGTANAQPVTISFWVRSSVTGSYTFSVGNGDYNRQYATTYAINAANTWEYKTITIPGDTTGTWATNNTAGVRIWFDLGTSSNAFYTGTANTWSAGQAFRLAGTVQLMANSGATFFVTGVQLEKGTQATPFEPRPIGAEIQLCKRYYEKQSAYLCTTSTMYAGWRYFNGVTFSVEKRANPTVIVLSATNEYPGGASRNVVPSVCDAYSWAVNDTQAQATLMTVQVSASAEI
jgi:hypothetical protein